MLRSYVIRALLLTRCLSAASRARAVDLFCKSTMRRLLALTLTLLLAHNASAGISYTGGTWTENFDTKSDGGGQFVGGLPALSNPFTNAPLRTNANGHIQSNASTAPSGTITEEWPAVFPGGWKDDSATDATNLGVPGWYLWSDVTTLTTATGGVNSHAQVRYGGGNTAGGSGFMVFGVTLCTNCGEKALGIRSASAFTDSNAGRRSYVGLQLINGTAETLNTFTITYDGEQYSEAAGASQDGFDLQWSLVASAAGWHDNPTDGGFYNNGVSGVDYGGFANSFLSPINNNPGTAAPTHNIAGNRVADIAHTISGISWAPGEELWIRWRDGDAHDGIGIDNVRFTAATVVVGPLVGDFNSDGKVDAGDYVTWRKNEVANATLPNDDGATDQAGRYTLWRANYGNPPGAGSGSGLGGANVPEPSSMVLVLAGLAALPIKRNRGR